MRSQDLDPAGCEIGVVGHEFPTVLTASFREQAVVDIVRAGFEVGEHSSDIGGGKRVVVPGAELQNLAREGGRSLAHRPERWGLAECFEVRLGDLVECVPLDAAVAVQILAQDHSVHDQPRSGG